MTHILAIASIKNLMGDEVLKRFSIIEDELKKNQVKYTEPIYRCLLSAHALCGDTSFIIPLFQRMIDDEIIPTRRCINDAMHFAARFGKSIIQAQILDLMEHYQYKKTTKVYAAMLYCMRVNEEIERAFDTVEEMKKNNINTSVSVYLSLVRSALDLECSYTAYKFMKEARSQSEFNKTHEQICMQILHCAAYTGDVSE
ncbi:hypothetical protein BDF14DRAFT_1729696 [Spinellus fusiger]|nr:hypothetical protein BDF14DRAFT_1729696 [Spinellus fusiger]